MSEEKRLEPFVGKFEHLIDDKQRFCLPADYLNTMKARSADPTVYLIKMNGGDFKHVAIYDQIGYDALKAKEKVVFRNVFRPNFDAQHRFVMPHQLLELLDLKKMAVFSAAPNGTHVRLWQPSEHLDYNIAREEARTPLESDSTKLSDRIQELVDAHKPYEHRTDDPKFPFDGEFFQDICRKRRIVLSAKHREQVNKRNAQDRKLFYVSWGQEFALPYATLHDVDGFDHARKRSPGLFDCGEYFRREMDDEERICIPDGIAKQAQLKDEVALVPSPDGDYIQIWNAKLHRILSKNVERAG